MTNFPTSPDAFPAAATLAGHTLASDPHSTLHGNLGDALAAVEVWLLAALSPSTFLLTLTGNASLSGTNTGDQDLSGYVPTSRTVNGHPLSANVTVSAADVGLGNVTNDVQTKAAIVPNTAPTSGMLLIGNNTNTAYAPTAISGDATLFSTGTLVLADSSVTAGSYTSANITVDSKGRVLAASNGTAGTAVAYSVNQTAHGFSVGNWLKLVSANTYALAKADAAANADYIGVVSSVTNANTFVLTISGEVTLSSLTVGNYFGSPTTAGAMATTAPTSAGQVQILLGRAISTTVFVVEIKQGMVLSALTNHGVVVGTGTGVTATATGASGVPLIGQGGSSDPVFQATAVKIDSHFGAITADTDASTVTMDLSVSDWHTLLLTSAVGGNRTLAVSNPTVGQQFAVVLQQPASGGPCTVTWFSGILWSGGTVPTLTTTASKRDVFGFKCISAGVYLGFIMGQNF